MISVRRRHFIALTLLAIIIVALIFLRTLPTRYQDAPLELLLHIEDADIILGDTLSLRLSAKNHTTTDLILNGWQVPLKGEMRSLEWMHTPLLIRLRPHNVQGGKKLPCELRHTLVMRDVYQVPPHSRFQWEPPFYVTGHSMDLQEVDIEAPPQVGEWDIWWELALPFPDPDDERTWTTRSNIITIKVDDTDHSRGIIPSNKY